MRIFMLIGFCCVALGCSNDQLGSRLASWQGSHFNDVAAAWGAPDECSTDESLRLCEWHVSVATTSPVNMTSCVTTLAFDDSGYVTGWRWRGDRCPQTAARVAANTATERPAALSIDSGDNRSGVAVIESPEKAR